MSNAFQFKLLKNEPKAYGGSLLNTREGRKRGRPLDTKNSMHLVLKSSLARGSWSFSLPANRIKISAIIQKFSKKYGLKIYSYACVGNHMHIHFQLGNRHTYKPFIRAVTSAIMMAITGISRWKKSKTKLKFWDSRPFTRVVLGWKSVLRMRDYIEINRLQGFGYARNVSRFFVTGNMSGP